MRISFCTPEDRRSILDILNEAILNTTALYDYHPRSLASLDAWFEAKAKGGFPVIGAFDEADALSGFGSYGVFRNWPAYKYSVEHSIYVRDTERGKGIGGMILGELIRSAEGQGYHTLIAGIDSGNLASVKLHEKYGFSKAGEIKQAGYKFGRWLDLVFYQRILPTPLDPKEG